MFLLVCSCKSNSQTNPSLESEDCYYSKANKLGLPENLNSESFIKYFESKNEGLIFLHIRQVSGYDLEEHYRLIYSDGQKSYLRDEKGTRKIDEVDNLEIVKQLEKIESPHSLIACPNRTSSREYNSFYLKKDKEVVFTFSINDELKTVQGEEEYSEILNLINLIIPSDAH